MTGQTFCVAIGCASAITIAHIETRHNISMGFHEYELQVLMVRLRRVEQLMQVEITVKCLNIQFEVKLQHVAGKYRGLWTYEIAV